MTIDKIEKICKSIIIADFNRSYSRFYGYITEKDVDLKYYPTKDHLIFSLKKWFDIRYDMCLHSKGDTVRCVKVTYHVDYNCRNNSFYLNPVSDYYLRLIEENEYIKYIISKIKHIFSKKQGFKNMRNAKGG